MNDEDLFKQLPGATQVVEWFGYWPSFHDGEVVELTLRREVDSSVTIHAFRATNELDDHGRYVCDKHALVTFALRDVFDSELLHFNHQNVLSDLGLERRESGYRLHLGNCYGLEGWIDAADITVSFTPGLPPGSIYERSKNTEFSS